MENKVLQELRELLENRKLRKLKALFDEMNEVDIALLIEELSPEEATLAFRTLGKDLAAEVFANLEGDTQQIIISSITDNEISAIIEELFVDDAVDMIEDMPANVVKRVLRNAKPETRALINQFLKYPENSAGSIMTAEFVRLRPAMTVDAAIAHIRATGADRETIYTCYVTDPVRVLLGVVTVKDLLLADPESPVEKLMETEIISVKTGDDQEEAVGLMQKYDLLALPVVDSENRLVGIVTVDDAVDVIEQEATEDFEKMAAIAPSDEPYLKTPVWRLARNRIVWLLVLMVSGMITGGILGRYEAAFAAIPLLVTFIPMLTDTGGNAGSQSSTLIIRGMAVGEIEARDVLKVLWKEFRVSLLVGVALGVVNFIRLMITYPGQWEMSLTVSLAIFATVVIAKGVGGILPIFAKAVKLDPAIMASPLITTIVDALGLIIYFSIAQQLLPI